MFIETNGKIICLTTGAEIIPIDNTSTNKFEVHILGLKSTVLKYDERAARDNAYAVIKSSLRPTSII